MIPNPTLKQSSRKTTRTSTDAGPRGCTSSDVVPSEREALERVVRELGVILPKVTGPARRILQLAIRSDCVLCGRTLTKRTRRHGMCRKCFHEWNGGPTLAFFRLPAAAGDIVAETRVVKYLDKMPPGLDRVIARLNREFPLRGRAERVRGGGWSLPLVVRALLEREDRLRHRRRRRKGIRHDYHRLPLRHWCNERCGGRDVRELCEVGDGVIVCSRCRREVHGDKDTPGG